WLEALGQFNPAMVDACQSAYRGGRLDLDFYRVNRELFAACPSDSIDYAVMERVTAERDGTFSGRGVVVPLDVGWSDVGAWAALWEVSDKDAQGNVIKGDVYAYETNNALLVSEHRLVTCVGLDDVIVIETPDAVMVAHQSRAQDVKQIVAHLKSQKRSEYLLHRKVSRPWGHYDSIDNGERFQVKRIVVNPGATLSMQMHHHRAEHWIVVRGTARVTRGDELFLLTENQSTYIPIGITHRLENPGTIPYRAL
ncbi:MAG: mannose-1-phosphate guanylyltransferase / mannose-6-phosphate isomerase, partial [Halothiobacillaceae bacterium]